MKRNSFDRKKRQFANLSKRVNHLIFNGEWEKLSVNTRKILIQKLNLLFRELSHYFSHFELKKILAAAAIFIGFPLVMQSQQFSPPQENPFGLTHAEYFAIPEFADIDNDGDLDLFEGVYYGNMLYYENTGTATTPAFASPLTNPFGLVPTYYNSLPAFADLDGDGAEDLLVGEYLGNFQYFENATIHIGITENLQEAIFDLSPNPATDGVSITLKDDNPSNAWNVFIINLQGEIVESGIINSQKMKLNLEGLSPGFYFVRLIRDDEVFTRRLIVR
ncbi:MAG: T9SS type A sorting domain-containing protein [Bacteroidales bacterium]|nr:T9SS type A sorting domain-containing protein [Bacteroidales bacterium]